MPNPAIRHRLALLTLLGLACLAAGCVQVKTQRATLEYRDRVVTPDPPTGQAVATVPGGAPVDADDHTGR